MSYFSEQYIRICDDITIFGPDPDDIELPRLLLISQNQEPDCIECAQSNGEHTANCLGVN